MLYECCQLFFSNRTISEMKRHEVHGGWCCTLRKKERGDGRQSPTRWVSRSECGTLKKSSSPTRTGVTAEPPAFLQDQKRGSLLSAALCAAPVPHSRASICPFRNIGGKARSRPVSCGAINRAATVCQAFSSFSLDLFLTWTSMLLPHQWHVNCIRAHVDHFCLFHWPSSV